MNRQPQPPYKWRIGPLTVVTCDDSRRIIPDGVLHIGGDRLEFVGPVSEAPPFEADEDVRQSGLVAIPGLINTHTHAAMTLLRGFADDMSLEQWLHQKIWPFEAHLDGAAVYLGTMLAAMEMLLGGTTCMVDMYHHYEDGSRAMIESGIRACPGGVLLGFLPEPERRIEQALLFVEQYRGAGNGRITPMVAPHSLYTCNREQWLAMADGAVRLGVPLHTHLAETRHEVANTREQWGGSPVEALIEAGATRVPVLAAHCVWLDAVDRELMGTTRTSTGAPSLRVLLNPTSNLKLASGFAPLGDYLHDGIPAGLATDGAASNNNLDMWQEIHLTALVHKAVAGDPTVVTAEEALSLATNEAARCLGLENEIGSLVAGKKADVVLVDMNRPHLTPCHHVVSNLVYSAGAGDVHSVWVDGERLVQEGRLTRLDAPAIMQEVRTMAGHLATLVPG